MTRKLKFAAAAALGIALVGATAVTATAGDNKVHGRYTVTVQGTYGFDGYQPGEGGAQAFCKRGDRASFGGFHNLTVDDVDASIYDLGWISPTGPGANGREGWGASVSRKDLPWQLTVLCEDL